MNGQSGRLDELPGTRLGERTVPWLASLEVALATAAVLLDLLIPSLCLLVLACLSLLARRAGPSTLGLRSSTTRMLAAKMLLLAAGWSLMQLAVTMPIAAHVSGTRKDMGIFADVQGDVGLMLLLLALGWTLGALAEEVAFRGYLLTRMRDLLGPRVPATVAAVLASSLLFGIAHSEQGVVGVVMVSLDAVLFCAVRLVYDTVWASVLLHGWINTVGVLAFFLVGPVYGLW
jgi:uncharacterized protein